MRGRTCLAPRRRMSPGGSSKHSSADTLPPRPAATSSAPYQMSVVCAVVCGCQPYDAARSFSYLPMSKLGKHVTSPHVGMWVGWESSLSYYVLTPDHRGMRKFMRALLTTPLRHLDRRACGCGGVLLLGPHVLLTDVYDASLVPAAQEDADLPWTVRQRRQKSCLNTISRQQFLS